MIGAGGLKTRSNDTDFRFRPHSAFAYLTGLGTDREPDAVLVLEPSDAGHDGDPVLQARAHPGTTAEFYADSRFGELWVGRRPTLDEMSALCGIRCAAIDDLADQLRKDADTTPLRVLPVDLDEAVAALIDEVRSIVTTGTEELSPDAELAQVLSELRLVKDEFEIAELREACRQTIDAFAAVVAELPEAVRRGRGERWIEGIFGLHARHVGNAVGYDTIAAAGEHACTLHWIRNDGDVREGELLLLDAGVELDSLYTADITRTLPISGRFSDAPAQGLRRRVRGPAGRRSRRPGRVLTFLDVHHAAIAVIAEHLAEWGLLPVSAEESLSRGRRPAPALDGARHLAPPRHRRARLRPGPPGALPGGHAGAGHGDHRRARALLQARRRAGAGRAARDRRPDRGRHRDHRGGQRDPVRTAAAAQHRGRGVDGLDMELR